MQLLRQVTIADQLSPYNGQTVDLLIEHGHIAKVAKQIRKPKDCPVYHGKGQWLSPGFLDIGPYLGDPGAEEREDIDSLVAAARRGGYTQLAVLPNTNPVRQDKSGIDYLRRRAENLAVELLPLGAVSRDTKGVEITEMIDMQQAGAVAFTDGLHPIQSAGILKLALNYVKVFGGTIINQPIDLSLAPNAQLHEGPISTQLGMAGFPEMSETIALQRDIELLAYTDSRLLVHLISTSAGLKLVRAARKKGLQLFSSVSAAHLQFTVAAVEDFDPNFKFLPPLREDSDRKALIKGILDGSIDHIASHHQSHHPEAKVLEFPYADFGSQGLEACIAQAYTVLEDKLTPAAFCALFSHGPRTALGLEKHSIEKGQPANLSLFDPDMSWTPTADDFGTKSTNSPLLGQELLGRPVATYHKEQLWTSV